MLQLSRNFSSDRLVEFFQAISQTTAITLRGSRQEKSRRASTPDFSHDFHPSPLPCPRHLSCATQWQLASIQMHTQIGPRTGVADSGHFDGFRVPLSSAPFCIRLVIRHFSKATEDRSPAGTAISHPCGHPPVPTGKVNRFHTNSGHFLPANPHTPLIPLTPLEAGGRKDQAPLPCAEGGKSFLPACLHATSVTYDTFIGAFRSSGPILPASSRCFFSYIATT